MYVCMCEDEIYITLAFFASGRRLCPWIIASGKLASATLRVARVFLIDYFKACLLPPEER